MAAEELLPADGSLRLFEGAIPKGEADRLLEAVLGGTDWRQDHIAMFGKRIALPRLTAWHGDAAYRYSGIVNEPRPWTPPLLELREIASAHAGQDFNSVLLNLYRDGTDRMGWHADDEPELGPEPVIASISLGARRRFRLRHREDRSLRLALDLPHGSCLVMAGAIQHHWQHALPPTRRTTGSRVNLTFRRIVA